MLKRQTSSNFIDWESFFRKLNMLGEEQRSYLEFFKDTILPNLPDSGSVTGHNRIEGSLLLFSLIGKYIALTKNDENLDSLINDSFTDKQMTIIEFMLRELLDVYRGGALIKSLDKQKADREIFNKDGTMTM